MWTLPSQAVLPLYLSRTVGLLQSCPAEVRLAEPRPSAHRETSRLQPAPSWCRRHNAGHQAVVLAIAAVGRLIGRDGQSVPGWDMRASSALGRRSTWRRAQFSVPSVKVVSSIELAWSPSGFR
jgi:hypothetical protein